MTETKLYTYREAAYLLGLLSPSGVQTRIESLRVRGLGLTVEAGELLELGARLVLTERGLVRLRNFEPRKPGRKPNTRTDSWDYPD